MTKLKKITEVIEHLISSCFTGILVIKIEFNQGGIRYAIKNIEDKISDS